MWAGLGVVVKARFGVGIEVAFRVRETGKLGAGMRQV